MAVISATMTVKSNMVMPGGEILVAGDYDGCRIPERPSMNAPGGMEPASWKLYSAGKPLDVTDLVKSGDITVITELD